MRRDTGSSLPHLQREGQQCERSRPRSVATHGRRGRARIAIGKAHCRGDILADLSEEQLDGIRRRVRASIEHIKAGKFVEYEGREGLKKLAEKARTRK